MFVGIDVEPQLPIPLFRATCESAASHSLFLLFTESGNERLSAKFYLPRIPQTYRCMVEFSSGRTLADCPGEWCYLTVSDTVMSAADPTQPLTFEIIAE
jgi:hypothetical protein